MSVIVRNLPDLNNVIFRDTCDGVLFVRVPTEVRDLGCVPAMHEKDWVLLDL